MLNIGPRYDGSLRYESLLRLNEIGDWLKVNGSSIYGAGAYDLNSDIHDWGKITYKNEDKHKIYLHVINWPIDNNLFVTGIKSKPVKIYSLSDLESASSSSFEAFLNSFIPLPNPFINSGIFLPPKSKRTTTTIRIICGAPIMPRNNIVENIKCIFIQM